MQVIKRDGKVSTYKKENIKRAVKKAFKSVNKNASESDLNEIVNRVESSIEKSTDNVSVEAIQDLVEIALMELNHYEVLKSYIIYREKHTDIREHREELLSMFKDSSYLERVIKKIQKCYVEDEYSINKLTNKFRSMIKDDMSEEDKLSMLIKSAVELTTQESPNWEMIAGRLLYVKIDSTICKAMKENNIKSFYEKIKYLTKCGLYGDYILNNYNKEDIDYFEGLINNNRNNLLNYSGLDLLFTRYVIRTKKNLPIETPQEMFMGVAMHLAMNESKDSRRFWVESFYDVLSKLQITVATPTLSNARKPYHQLSSCFIDTVPDNLDGIYRSLDNFAKVSKFGGGMGMYFGKVRASGSPIRGFEGASGGVIRWIKLANDTAIAVDQLGTRQGSVAVYLDAWHKDLPEFLNLRTNNGDDRAKAHDVFPAICYPDYFWEQVRDNINGDWYLMCPHEVKTIKGYNLEDSYGDEWKSKYLDCVHDYNVPKRVIKIKDLVRLIIKSAVETGTPFVFNRDHVNKMNPNPHKGVIYSSNLCTEICQNMSEIEAVNQTVEIVDGEEVIVTRTKPSDFVVCNLASLCLGRIDVNNEEELSNVTKTTMRMLDNVIDLNFYPVPYAKLNNTKYRPVGLGVSGYHHMLAKNKIQWESQEHLDFVERVFDIIHYSAVEASCNNAKEKGAYANFLDSDWHNGDYFIKRGLVNEKWSKLAEKVKQYGVRNGYMLAIAPTGSTSIIAGTTAGIDPVMNRYFLEEKRNGLVPRVAPDLSMGTFWFYKIAHQINQEWSIKACGVRQRHIDQGQSMNIYITNEYTFRDILNLYLLAWQKGVKTIYYIRSKSLEVGECETCSS
jgi:ribonucleoside-diphosphate reductase alpha chain